MKPKNKVVKIISIIFILQAILSVRSMWISVFRNRCI